MTLLFIRFFCVLVFVCLFALVILLFIFCSQFNSSSFTATHPSLLNISSVQFSRSAVSNSLWPHGPQHARLPCPSPMPAARSKSCPLSWWRHTTISSFVVPLYIPLIHSPYGYLLICVLSKKIYCVTEFCFLFFLSNIVLLSPPACGTLLLTWGRCRAPHELLFHFLRHLSCSLHC